MTNAIKQYDHLKLLMQQSTMTRIQKSEIIWQIINNERKNRQVEITQMELKIKGENTNDPRIIVNHLNSYFTKIADQTPKTNLVRTPPTITTINKSPIYYFLITNEEEIKYKVKILKPKTSAGLD